MSKVRAVSDLADLRDQLDRNCLYGDAMLTLKWLIGEYQILETKLHSAYEEINSLNYDLGSVVEFA